MSKDNQSNVSPPSDDDLFKELLGQLRQPRPNVSALQQLLRDRERVQRIINITDNSVHKRTLLHWAVATGDANIVDLFLQCAPDLEVKDRSQSTPLHLAVEFDTPKIAELLLSKGASLEAQDLYGFTPLNIAKERGNLAMERLLNHAKPSVSGGAQPTSSSSSTARIRRASPPAPLHLVAEPQDTSLYASAFTPTAPSTPVPHGQPSFEGDGLVESPTTEGAIHSFSALGTSNYLSEEILKAHQEALEAADQTNTATTISPHIEPALQARHNGVPPLNLMSLKGAEPEFYTPRLAPDTPAQPAPQPNSLMRGAPPHLLNSSPASPLCPTIKASGTSFPQSRRSASEANEVLSLTESEEPTSPIATPPEQDVVLPPDILKAQQEALASSQQKSKWKPSHSSKSSASPRFYTPRSSRGPR